MYWICFTDWSFTSKRAECPNLCSFISIYYDFLFFFSFFFAFYFVWNRSKTIFEWFLLISWFIWYILSIGSLKYAYICRNVYVYCILYSIANSNKEKWLKEQFFQIKCNYKYPPSAYINHNPNSNIWSAFILCKLVKYIHCCYCCCLYVYLCSFHRNGIRVSSMETSINYISECIEKRNQNAK